MRTFGVSPFIRTLAVTLVSDVSVDLQCEDKCNSLLLSQLANLLLDQKLNLPSESIRVRKLFALSFNARTNVTVRCFCWLPSCSWTGSSACQLNESTSVTKLFVLSFRARTNITVYCFCGWPACSWTGSWACKTRASVYVSFNARINITVYCFYRWPTGCWTKSWACKREHQRKKTVSVELQCEDKCNSRLLFQVANLLLDRKLRRQPRSVLIVSISVSELLVAGFLCPLYTDSLVRGPWRHGLLLCSLYEAVFYLQVWWRTVSVSFLNTSHLSSS